MFGFLAPRQRIPQWRRSYARVCQYQRKLFGITSLPFLSYEAAFLYQVAVDSELIPALGEEAPTCCRLRRLAVEPLPDERIGSYAAALGVVLAGVKLDDDVRDSGRFAHRLLRWKYRDQVAAARTKMAAIAPGSVTAIDTAVEQHMVLENQASVSLTNYIGPTGQGFATVFAGASEESQETLFEVGQSIGRSIIAYDCAVDYERDRVRGDFNPLRGDGGVQQAFEVCLLELAKLGWKLPEGSVSQRVVASVVNRVHCQMNSPVINKTKLLERWGLIRQRGYTYAGCDGCEAVCCVTECCGGAAEAGTCCGEAGCCCDGFFFCPCDACCCDPSGSSATGESKKAREAREQREREANRQQGPTAGPYAEYFGTLGETCDELSPSGFVSVEGARVPAVSDSGMLIPAGTTVRIVATDAFSVRVAPTTSRQGC